MITAEGMPTDQIKKLRELLNNNATKIKRELATAINATAKMGQREVSKVVREELAVPKKTVDKTISISRKANAGQLGATVSLSKTRRISLREFGPKQNQRGVSFKISKTRGRQFVAGAFQGPKPGAMKISWRGNAFVRAGKSRLPILKLKGPSPWGVMVKKKLEKPTGAAIQAELRKQIDRRIRLLMLRASGQVR
jgi:hypothetical protein